MTESEAMTQAQEWADVSGEIIYVTQYVNHATPQEPMDA